MEDIKVDLKLVVITICISAFLGILIWAGYNLYIELTQDENEGIEYFEEDMESSGDSTYKIESNESKTDFSINDIVGEDGFEINNSNSGVLKEGWVKRITNFKVSGYSTIHYIPNDWQSEAGRDKKDGATIYSKILKVENLSKETTYEEFLNKFIETKENEENSPQEVKNYSKRIVNINGENFYVFVEEEYYNAVYEYFCLAKDNYAYYLEVATSKQNYDQEFINSMNEIFATYRIY